MLIPLGTDVRLRRPTLVTYVLMALCVFVFVGQKVSDNRTPSNEPPRYYQFMLFSFDDNPDRVMGEFEQQVPGERGVIHLNPGRWYQYVTYQFLHGSWMHLLGNMVFLLVFGPPVEDRFRRFGFLGFYLFGGILAGVAHGVLETHTESVGGVIYRSVAPVLGASGSIAAVSGAYLVLFPFAHVRLISLFGMFALPGWMFVCLSIFFDLVFLASGDRGVAHFAHLGGYGAGAGVAMLLLWRKVLPRETYDLFSMAKQAHRRRTYRALVAKGPSSSPFIKDAAIPRKLALKDHHPDPHSEERRAIASLAPAEPKAATDRYLELSGTDEHCTLARDAQLVVANTLFERGDHENAVEAYERFLKRYPDDRETDQTRLLVAMVCARHLNDPVCATRHLDTLDEAGLPEGLRELAQTIREELS